MKKVFLAAVCCIALASCSTSLTTPLAVTSNPVGTKCGVATYKSVYGFGSNKADVGINEAAKNGGITRISHVDTVMETAFFGLIKTYTTKVYGE